jgi:hypothetical protein
MKWRMLEGGGQAFYELGVADSGELVGLVPDDLRATLDTLHAMAAEIGARVVISKEIEVTATAPVSPELGFRALVEKRRGSREGGRAAVKNHLRHHHHATSTTVPVPVDDADGSPRSYTSTTSTSTTMTSSSSCDDSTNSSITTDSLLYESSPSLSSSSSPITGAINIPISKPKVVPADDPLIDFPLLTESVTPADDLLTGGESFIDTLLGAIPEKSITEAKSRHDDVSLPLAVPAVGFSPDRDEDLLVAALGKLGFPNALGESKRTIVEATVIRELDQEEGFIDFSSF